MVKVTYADLRKEHSEQEVADALRINGYSEDRIMQNEFAYKKAHGLIEYPEKKSSSFQEWALKHENIDIERMADELAQTAEGYGKAVKSGYDESVTGMLINKKLPEQESYDFTAGQRVVKGLSGVVSDLGVYGLGGLLGGVGSGANPVLATMGAFALHDYTRSVLIDLYKKGEIKSFGELMDRISEFDTINMAGAVAEGFKGGATGFAVSKANIAAKNLSDKMISKMKLNGMEEQSVRVANELAFTTPVLVGSNSLLNLQVPTKDDFVEAAGVLLGLKLLPKSIGKPNISKTETPTTDTSLPPVQITYDPNMQNTAWNPERGGQIKVNIQGIDSAENIQWWTDYLMGKYANEGKTPQQVVVDYKENPTSLLPKTSGSYVIWDGAKHPVRYEVVDADSLITSHDSNGNKNPDFPDYMQNRERDRKPSREQVNNIASNFIPERVIDSYEPQTGAPIVTKDGHVIVGNGRLEGIKLAYDKQTTGEYRDFIEQIDPEAPKDKKMVIIRRLVNDYSEDEIKNLVQKSNQSTTLRLSKSEIARDDASRIDDNLLDLLDTDTELSSAENKSFIDAALNKVIPENEKGSLLDKDGKITGEAISRINNALLANVISDERMLSKLIETDDPILKKVGSGIAKSSPAIVRMESEIDKGNIKDSFRIQGDINGALNLYEKFKKSGMSFDDFVKQGDVFEKPTATEETLLEIYQSTKGANVIKDILDDYARTAEEVSGGFNFDLPEMTKVDILKGAYKRRTGKELKFTENTDINKEWEDTFGNASVEEVKKDVIVNDFEKETYQKKIDSGMPEKQAILETNIESITRDSGRINGDRVIFNEVKNDEVTDILFGETPEDVPVEGLTKSDIYLGDKSMINVSYSGDLDITPVSKTDIADNFKKRFDVAYRKGKIHKKGTVLGFYKPRQEVIRTRGYDDFSTLVHETAHHLDKVLFKNKQTLPEGKEREFGNELGSIASVGNPFQEGFAEFVSYYVTNPEYVQKNTPKFYKHFVDFMKKNEPDILEVLDGAQRDWKAWRLQSSDARVRGQISYKLQKAGLSIQKLARDLYTNLIDEFYPLKVLERDVLKRAKQRNPKSKYKLLPSESPYILARLHRGVAEKLSNYLEKYAFDTELNEVGESYKSIFGDLSDKDIQELDLYLIAKRALTLNKRGIETGIGTKDAKQVVDNLSRKWQPTAARVYRYIENLAKYLIDSGLLSREKYAQMKKLDPYYVPFQRELPTDDRPSARKLSPNQAIKRIKGSDRRIIPPSESLLKLTINAITNGDKNHIMSAIAELARFEGSGKFLEKVPSMQKVNLPKGASLIVPNEGSIGGNTVILTDPQFGDELGVYDMEDGFWIRKPADKRTQMTVMENGEPSVYEISPELANLVNGLLPEDFNVLVRLGSIPANYLRAGATSTLEFMIKNIFRDTLEAFINSRKGQKFTPFISSLKGLSKLVRSDKAVTEWQNAGGDMANMIPRDRGSLQRRIKQINKNYDLIKNTGYLDAIWNQVKKLDPINIAELLSKYSENSTRVEQSQVSFDYYKRKGYSDYDAKLMGAFASRESTIDFARRGAKMRAINLLIPFFNAMLQGTDKMARNIISHPVNTLSSIGTLGLVSLYLYFANKGDEDIEDMNKTIKDTHWVTKIGGEIKKFPKPQNAVPFLTMLERALDSSPDEMWTNVESGIVDLLELNVWNNIPTFVKPAIEKERNRTSYLGMPLIPAHVEKLMPEYQVTKYSSETAKWLAKTLSDLGIHNSYASPIVIDNFIYSWSGGYGQYVLKGLDYAISGKFKEDLYSYENTPFFKAFRVAYPRRSNSQAYREFMDKSNDLLKKHNTAKHLLKNNPEDTSYSEYMKYGVLSEYRSTITELGRILDAIYENKDLSTQDKRQSSDAVNRQMIEISKKGLALIESLSK